MTRREFTDRVLLPLTRLTREEREAVRQELEEHIEDRMESMLERGWARELAEERCLEAMGDPAEIGREMAKQYRGRGWLWLGRAALLLAAVLCIQAVFSFGMLGCLKDSVSARLIYVPEGWPHDMEQLEASAPMDVRISVGNDVLRLARVNVGRSNQFAPLRAELVLYAYDRVPGGVVSQKLLDGVSLETQQGKCFWTGYSFYHFGHYMVERSVHYADVEPGDEYVTLVYQRFGEDIRVQIPLPEEGEA